MMTKHIFLTLTIKCVIAFIIGFISTGFLYPVETDPFQHRVSKISQSKPAIHHKSIPLKYSYKDVKCLALNIYYEARNQSLLGQLAVGYVTINRKNHKRFPNTICKVVKQKSQFSWYNGKEKIPKEKRAWKEALRLAETVLKNYSKDADITNNALFYHADYVDPYWSYYKVKIKKIGNHVFYR